jgi:hypothetical protein
VKWVFGGFLLLCLVGGCGGGSPGGPPLTPPPAEARKHIPGIDQMGLEELSKWVTVCAPYNGSLEGRAKNPYDPMDCDQVQYRHDSWRQPRTQKPAQGLPALH